MLKLTVQVDGMMCGMCEAHINDAVRAKLNVTKVSSSHAKNQTIIISENDISDEELKAVIGGAGYTFVSVQREPYEKKSFFSRFKK